jgi:superfamily II DNA or RNA helicase
MAGYDPNFQADIQVASVQSLLKRLHLYKHFDLIVCDEAHHSSSNSYLKIFAAYPKAYVLGVTATPCRIDGKGLGDLFSVLVHGEQVQALIDLGNLVPPKYITTPSSFDLADVKMTGGDYNKKQLAKAVRDAQIQGDLVKHWLEHAQDLQTIVFAVDCEHSREIVEQYRQSGIKAEHIDANTHFETRARIIKQFAAKEIQVLSNVSIFTEGFDLPEIACVQIARPTKSVSLYYQMVGRALRPLAGKTEAIVLDHAGVFHELGSVADPKYWELNETKPKRARERDFEQTEREKTEIKIDVTTKLVVVCNNTPQWAKDLNGLLKSKAENNYKKGWVIHQFLKQCPAPDLIQAKTLGRALGFHHQWADHFMAKISSINSFE